MTRILVVDDELTMREYVSRILSRAGHEMDEAENGHEAIRQFKQRPADLAIVDIIMPVMDGVETIRQLRLLDRGLKIIAMSGAGTRLSEKMLEIAERLGANLIMRKPFSPEELIEQVNGILQVESAE